jgi:NAD(P)-dependent dehydrogenase (short-subunit alcohol dehydrogenase family)
MDGMIERPAAFADLSGRVAFVTGASSGIGERFARVLASCGARVAVTARRKERLDALVEQITAAGGVAIAIVLDIRDEAAIAAAVAEAEATLGPVDILINNAGINYGKRAVGMTGPRFDDEMGTNLRGPWLLACAVARRLIELQTPGRIINISSIGAFITSKPGSSLYSVSKAAVVRMTEVLAVEWAPHFINVNAIAPGTFETEMTSAFVSNDSYVQSLPRKRICSTAQLDSTLLYLVSPLSDAVTGTVIKVDDGQTPR